MTRPFVALLLVVMPSIAALAHSGVTNPAVMKRMDSMKASGDSMDALGRMVKGEDPFDAALARQMIDRIAGHAAQTPALFKAHETDPKMEAKPEVWEDFSDFTDKANSLEILANTFADQVAEPADLATAVGALSKACRECHSTYKK